MRDKRKSNRIRLITRERLAAELDVSAWTIWSWTKQGILPKPIKMTPGSPPKWRVCDIEMMLDRKQRKARESERDPPRQ